jgi:hypothetical protein
MLVAWGPELSPLGRVAARDHALVHVVARLRRRTCTRQRLLKATLLGVEPFWRWPGGASATDKRE